MSMPVTVKELWLYPVKSLAGIRVNSLSFDVSGPIDDRRWMLVDQRGHFVSQRSHRAMALFRLNLNNNEVQVKAPSGSTLSLPKPDAQQVYQPVAVTVWKDELIAYEVDAAASTWFSQEMRTPVRLVWLGNQSERRISDWAAFDTERVGFADGYPLLVCNQASIDRLNHGEQLPLEQRRFRPNIVAQGLPANRELALGEWQLAGGVLAMLKTCERCNIPAIDPETAEYQKDTAARIKTECRYQGRTVFGVNAVARGLDLLKQGDSGPWIPGSTA